MSHHCGTNAPPFGRKALMSAIKYSENASPCVSIPSWDQALTGLGCDSIIIMHVVASGSGFKKIILMLSPSPPPPLSKTSYNNHAYQKASIVSYKVPTGEDLLGVCMWLMLSFRPNILLRYYNH